MKLEALEDAEALGRERGRTFVAARMRRELQGVLDAAEPVSGMSVPYVGPLASVRHLPSVQRDLRDWIRLLDALEKSDL